MINLEDLARVDTNYQLSLSNSSSRVNGTSAEFNQVFRTGVGFFIVFSTGRITRLCLVGSAIRLLSLAIVQYMCYILFYQRFIEDKITNFIDLCSVSNVSLFILDQDHHGHYIHGRSPHGTSDVNMKDMIKNLERESKLLSAMRGLLSDSTEQVFILKINQRFRRQYDSFFRASNVSECRSVQLISLAFTVAGDRIIFDCQYDNVKWIMPWIRSSKRIIISTDFSVPLSIIHCPRNII